MRSERDTSAGGQGPLSTLSAWRRGLLSRGAASIRRKLILLHTLFSLVVAGALLLALRQPIRDLVAGEELRECRLALEMLTQHVQGVAAGGVSGREGVPEVGVRGVELLRGDAERVGISKGLADAARAAPGEVVDSDSSSARAASVRYLAATDEFLVASAQSPEARSAVDRVYLLLTVALLTVYGVIVLALEVLVLPRQVYGPIARLRMADDAVREDRREMEVIPEAFIPADELGDIMRSRNRTVMELRSQEAALEDALKRLETVATELSRKNQLLEAAQRNLADQDRLVSLGMMSAGIAHELNTPLAVLKGSVEELARRSASGGPDPERVALMLRVVNRLERLSESLLDFARVRPPLVAPVDVSAVVSEAWTLVSLDRDARGVDLRVDLAGVGGAEAVRGDGDRLTQVFVNLLRNAVDAMEGERGKGIEVRGVRVEREGRSWACVTIADTGPGIAPSLFPRLFEPFASTRLDSTGTGLGLAVAEGIVREHGGVLLARNASREESGRGFGGAVFEVLLPVGVGVGVVETGSLWGGRLNGG
jgi:signal transduction histidine kinase